MRAFIGMSGTQVPRLPARSATPQTVRTAPFSKPLKLPKAYLQGFRTLHVGDLAPQSRFHKPKSPCFLRGPHKIAFQGGDIFIDERHDCRNNLTGERSGSNLHDLTIPT
jgi:hypothetical protein